ncbi:MAG: ABC transporter permease [Anaerolineae bacterium]|nr:ABC transporter permease [Anaerolineae bacterium]
MLNQWFADPLQLGLAQAVAAILLALVVVVIATSYRIHLTREVLVALARGFVQVVVVGLILVSLLQTPVWTAFIALIIMIAIAARISARRVQHIPGAFSVSLIGISLGGGLVILIMTLLGVIEFSITSLIPVGSMLIANAMNTNAQALERFRAEIIAHTGQIEAALSLSASPNKAIERYVQAAVQASMIPRIDSLASLGIVWIPGLMTGMILSGTQPVYAAIYQFVVIAMIFSSSGLTALISILLVRSHVFTPAEQLALRASPET